MSGGVLAAFVRSQGGAVTFERFMAWALYDPEIGYYIARVRALGPRGDFSTAATLSPLLATAIAGWARGLRAEIDQGGRWHVVEVGGGDGSLAEAAISALGSADLTWHLVERSPRLKVLQRERLGSLPVAWHAELRDALSSARGRAIVVSNELVDAFPCVVLRWNARWEELWLALDGDRVVEDWRHPVDPRLERIPWTLRDSRPMGRIEVHPSIWEWLGSWTPLLDRGHVLTVDYGEEADTLYHRRPAGTVRAYFQHLRMEGLEVYARPGHQDLTADVNFSDLAAFGEAWGLRARALCDQRSFVREHAPAEAAAADPGGAFSIAAGGMGTGHRVLWQAKEGTLASGPTDATETPP